MCLGIPGKVVQVWKDEGLGLSFGKVQFGGITKDVNLSYTPEVVVGDYVVVHVGFAISRLDEEEAHKVFAYLQKLDALEELQLPKERGNP